jgi:hypothetical protein
MELLTFYMVPIAEVGVTPPADLLHLIEHSKKISRFKSKHYPEGVICDTVYTHSHRFAAIAPNPIVRRIAWVHDLGENALDGCDHPLIEEFHNPNSGREKRELEADYIRQHLMESDIELYERYSRTSSFFKKGEGDPYQLDDNSVIAKTIDAVDGHLIFHFQLSAWTKKDNFDRKLMPNATGLTLGLNMNKAYVGYLHQLWSLGKAGPIKLGTLSYCAEMFNSATELVRDLWLDTAFQPEPIMTFFQDFKQYRLDR